MLRLDFDLVKHALVTAEEHGFASVEVALGEDLFEAKFLARKRKQDASEPLQTTKPELITVKSPAVGYFRFGAHPLEIGQEVKSGDSAGDVVSLGIAVEVFVKDGGYVSEILATEDEPVEYGQVLYELRKEPF